MIDPFSLASVPLIITSDGNVETHGSAFFYKKNENIYLVTNWHNLSGRNPDTGRTLSKTGAIPHTVSLCFHRRKLRNCTWPQNFSLSSDDGQSLWLQHPFHGQNVDVAVLKIVVPIGGVVYPINEFITADDMRIDIGMDVFVLGFPIRLFTGIYPIWKRATLSTEHDFNVDGLPKFLIDTATQKGMSGSPVILRQRGSYANVAGNMIMDGASATKFLGIYSGRYFDDEMGKVQLGVVWRKELIDEIINSGVAGNFQIREIAEGART